MKVLKGVLAEIKPTKEEENAIDKKIKDFMKRIKVKDAKIILGGSGAKGTWLKDVNDADIFIQFNYNKHKDKSDELSNILEKQLKKSFKKLDKLHGSRDYFQVKEKGFTFEIIPILEIKKAEIALNITDVSPLHADFVKKYSKLEDEIRLMKQFCKVNNLYGAESYINGFSGYMCELLVIYYGGFLKLIKNACKWKEKEIIDIKNFYKGKNVLFEMNKSKIISPIVLIDPVQSDRNAAAALSEEKYNLFIKKAKEFMKKPSKVFFEKKKVDINKLKKEFIILEAEALKGKEDVIGAKLLKVFEFLQRKLKKEGFEVTKQYWTFDKEKEAFFYLKVKDVSSVKIVEGPNVKFKDHVKFFKKKHKNTFVKKNVVYAKDKRKVTKAKDFVKNLLKDEYVKERVKKICIQ
jgi:tRNA nucleotidyltransferase (CCA-adding enzyme)